MNIPAETYEQSHDQDDVINDCRQGVEGLPVLIMVDGRDEVRMGGVQLFRCYLRTLISSSVVMVALEKTTGLLAPSPNIECSDHFQ